MANFCLFISESDGTRIPNSELQFALKANIGDTFVWQDSNVFTGLVIGSTHYFGIKKRSNGLILIEGDAFIVGNNSEPYEAVFEDVSEIIIPQSEHGKNKVASVIIIDSQNSIIGNNPTILTQSPDEETVIINFDEPQTVTIRIS